MSKNKWLELTHETRYRYRTAGKLERGRMLDHYCEFAGYSKLQTRESRSKPAQEARVNIAKPQKIGLCEAITRKELKTMAIGLLIKRKLFLENQSGLAIYLDRETWMEQIGQLVADRSGQEVRKLDVRTIELLRRAVKSDPEMTSEKWAAMTSKDALAYRVPGTNMGMIALATRFGAKGETARNREPCLELGEKIFGAGTVRSEKLQELREKSSVSITHYIKSTVTSVSPLPLE